MASFPAETTSRDCNTESYGNDTVMLLSLVLPETFSLTLGSADEEKMKTLY